MSVPESDDDDLNDVFFGPPSDRELERRAHQSHRRLTLPELASPVARRVRNMAVRSFVVVQPDDEVEPPTPAKVFEIASPSLDRYQVRWHSALMREIAAERYWERDGEEEEEEERPRVRSFVRVPSPLPFETIDAVELEVAESVCAIVEPLDSPGASVAVPCREATPSKQRVATALSIPASDKSGAMRGRALRFAELLAQRTALPTCTDASADLLPFRKADFSDVLRFLSVKQREAVGVAGA
jgi:hypothetical protein